MPRSDGSPLDPLPPEVFDGDKFQVEIKPSNHKHNFVKISPNEIRCSCGVGHTGSNIDTLLKLLTTE